MRFFLPVRGRTDRTQPQWLRAVAVLCLLLVCLASTVQVCHMHADLQPVSKDSRQNVPAPDHCPLCVAMHSALTATIDVLQEPVREAHAVALSRVDGARTARCSFKLSGRPPPDASADA